jgi:hypothetical protein
VAVIVLIHGIAQEQRSADSLEAEWLPALAGGLRAGGYGDLADRIWRAQGGPGGIETRMAFYGDCFLQLGVQGSGSGELTPEAERLAEQLARALLERAAADATSPQDRHVAQIELADLDDTVGQAQGPRSVTRSAAASLARLRWFAPYGMAFAQRFVDRTLVQVSRYFTDPQIRAYAQEQVARLVRADTRVLVGHSLGSVIAYEAAHRMMRPLPLLITLGSPLGLRTIVYERLWPQPPGFPIQSRCPCGDAAWA